MSHGVRAAGVLALAAGLAAAGEDEFDRGLARLELRAAAQAASERAERPSRERITLGGDDGASLWVGGTLQTRYQASFRDGDGLGSEDDTLGFSIRRLRIRLEGKLPDDRASFRIRTESAPGSETRLLEAYVDFRPVEGLRLRVGQSINRFSRIWYTPNTYQLAVDRPIVVNQTHPVAFLRSQGFEMELRNESDRFFLQLTEGSLSFNSGFDGSPDDWAVTARWDHKFAGAWSQLGQLTSPPGSEFAAVVGAGFHAEGSDDDEDGRLAWTVDGSVYGDGWVVTAGYLGRSAEDLNVGGSQPESVHSVFVEGGRYLSDRFEVFARYEHSLTSDDGVEDFSFVTAGFNYYFFGQPLKLSADISYAINEVDDVYDRSVDGLLEDLAGEDGQIVVRTQLQLLF